MMMFPSTLRMMLSMSMAVFSPVSSVDNTTLSCTMPNNLSPSMLAKRVSAAGEVASFKKLSPMGR